MLSGGVDSFNLLVPHSGCNGGDSECLLLQSSHLNIECV